MFKILTRHKLKPLSKMATDPDQDRGIDISPEPPHACRGTSQREASTTEGTRWGGEAETPTQGRILHR